MKEHLVAMPTDKLKIILDLHTLYGLPFDITISAMSNSDLLLVSMAFKLEDIMLIAWVLEKAGIDIDDLIDD